MFYWRGATDLVLLKLLALIVERWNAVVFYYLFGEHLRPALGLGVLADPAGDFVDDAGVDRCVRHFLMRHI